MKKVVDVDDFVRDQTTKALINTNAEALRDHRIRKQNMIEHQKLREDVDGIIEDIADIKQMLVELIKNR